MVMIYDENLVLMNVPANLFRDVLDVMTYLLDFSPEDVSLRWSPLAPNAEHLGASAAMLSGALNRYREICRTQVVSEALYDQYGLWGPQRTPHRLLHATFLRSIEQVAEEQRRAREAAQDEAALSAFRNVPEEERN